MSSPINRIQGIKYLWKLSTPPDSLVHLFAHDFNVSFPIARTLYTRGYISSPEALAFLFSSFEKDVTHPRLLKDGFKAVERILLAIEKQEKILIFGDYDVDGITSSSLLMVTLLPLKAQINFFLPHRERDGYGLSIKVVEQAKKSGYSLIITVDNGTTAYEPAARAAELGIDLIITDHHRPHGKLPHAHAIVNPHQVDCPYPFKGLPGVGIAFKVISLLYEHKGLTLPPKAYELLTFGIIADVMPLLSENRFWVREGLAKINKNPSYAFSVLAHNGKLQKKRVNSLDIGFTIAPQINALGRLSDARDAVKFLISSDHAEVAGVGKILFDLNEERKRLDRTIYDEVVHAINHKKIDLEKEQIIMAGGVDWPTGIIGLVAGKLMHSYGRPTIMFHLLPGGLAKGSARSIEAFNMFDALEANKDLLITFGGHSSAAGLSLKQENLVLLKERLEARIRKMLSADDLVQKMMVDSELELAEATKKLMLDLEKLEPFGHKNSLPLFLIRNVTLLKKPQLLKDRHVKCSLFSEGIIKPIIFFNRPDIYEVLALRQEEPFDVIAHVVESEWEGRAQIEFHGIDIAIP